MREIHARFIRMALITKVEAISGSYIGSRNSNQDAIFPVDADERASLFILCDGMGGHDFGNIAATVACKVISKFILNHIGKQDSKSLVENSFKLAKAQMVQMGTISPRHKDMGTTTSLLFVDKANNSVILGNIGDSRIYWFRGNQEIYRTVDHSVVMELYKKGIISKRQARTHPQKHLLSRVLSANPELPVAPDVIEYGKVKPGDFFILCSDGVWDALPDNAFETWNWFNISLTEARKQLLKECSRNATDNFSFHLIRLL